MAKHLSAREAVSLISDEETLIITGFNGFGCPEELLLALAERYDGEGHPKNLRLMKCTSQGNGKGRGVSCLSGKEDLFREMILSHMGNDPGIVQDVSENRVAAFMMPLGNLLGIYRAAGSGLPGFLTRTGIGTFADPRLGGGKVNKKAVACGREVVELLNIHGQECLFYPSISVDVAFIRASYADEDGNLSMKNEAAVLEQYYAAAAAHNTGGIVIAQVEKIVKRGSIPAQDVKIHHFMVDYVIEAKPEYHQQSFGSAVFRPELCGQIIAPNYDLPKRELDSRKVCCRRAALELKEGYLVNLGFGMPDGVGAVLSEEGVLDRIILSTESGPLGGMPLSGPDFGSAVNPEAFYSEPDAVAMYGGGALDIAIIGFAEISREGDVNAHSFNGRVVGPGGFIDITQNTRNIVFIGGFLAGKQQISVTDGKLSIKKDGEIRKLKNKTEAITFSAKEALKRGCSVMYITERAVFRLEEQGLTLTEIAPGIDLQKDVLDQMDFKPLISPNLKQMESRLFREELLDLRHQMEAGERW